jgi:hypothetical protein
VAVVLAQAMQRRWQEAATAAATLARGGRLSDSSDGSHLGPELSGDHLGTVDAS